MEMLLHKGETLSLGTSATQGRVCCLEGSCWLTCTGQPGDHLLHGGESLDICGEGPLLLNALRDCRIAVIPAANSRRLRFGTLLQAL